MHLADGRQRIGISLLRSGEIFLPHSVLLGKKCPACIGPLHFTGASGKLEYEYCGSSYDVAEIEALYVEKNEQEAAAHAAAEEKSAGEESEWDASGMSSDWGADGEGMKSYSCPSCGAELICDATTAAMSCPYCGNPSVVPGQFTGTLKPEFVLPFKLNKEDAVKALKRHYKGKILLPGAFTNGTIFSRSKAFMCRSGCLMER